MTGNRTQISIDNISITIASAGLDDSLERLLGSLDRINAKLDRYFSSTTEQETTK